MPTKYGNDVSLKRMVILGTFLGSALGTGLGAVKTLSTDFGVFYISQVIAVVSVVFWYLLVMALYESERKESGDL